jgi:IMP dehydrogenase
MSNHDTKISQLKSATYREFILIPRNTRPEHALTEVQLNTRLAGDFSLTIPFMSAAMESVTGTELSIGLALHGGLGILPAGRVEPEDQVRMVEEVKAHWGGFHSYNKSVPPETTLRDVDALEERLRYSSFPVIDEAGKLIGSISSRDYDPRSDLDLTARDKMRHLDDLVVYSADEPRSKVIDAVLTRGHDRGYLVGSDGKLHGLLNRKAVKDELRFRGASRDVQGRLQVGVAISTHPEDRDRARKCIKAGADLISVDASDGYSDYMRDTVLFAKEFGVPVVAGNVVGRESFRYLAECGADAVKIGIGSGSICTTRRVKAIGRGQATAMREVAMERDDWAQKTGKYIPLISDGGLAGTGDMSVALAMGADVLMMGRYFAAYSESPTQAYEKKFWVSSSGGTFQVAATVKPYWGEASARAKNVRRYQQNDPRTFVVEGEEGYVLLKGSLHQFLPKDLKAIKGTLSSCGCANLDEFRREVLLERQSVGSQEEGGTSILLV